MKIKRTIMSAAMSLFIAGCANTGTSAASDVDPDLKKDEPKFFSRSGATACAGGALITGLACLLLKDDKREVCLAAAAAGCVLGMTSNYVLDKLRSNYHNLEDQLDAVKAQVQVSIKSTESLNENIRETLNDDNKEIEMIEKGIADGTKSQSDLEKKVSQMEHNIEYLKSRLAKDQENLKAQTEAYEGLKNGEGGVDALNPKDASRKKAELEESIAKANENLLYLQNEISTYAERTNALRAGMRDKAA
ncbi:MAG: hypothetical protein ACI4UM_08040 [Succinivibrio sp.]